MATRYLLKINPLVLSEDIPVLPEQLQTDFNEVFQPILQTDPHGCEGFPWHTLKVLTYAKVHTCEFSAEAELTPGEDFPVCTLNTAQGSVKLGFMICFQLPRPGKAEDGDCKKPFLQGNY